MHKRIEIVVRNPGYEGTDSAMGTLTMDFEDEGVFERELSGILSELTLKTKDSPRTLVLRNERGQRLGFNPEYYVSFRADDVDDWRPTWLLPAEGQGPSADS